MRPGGSTVFCVRNVPSSNDIRRDFLAFFHGRGHAIVPSSPLVPGNDPTLLFTNAGMVQFKDVFLGAEKRSYNRAVSSQRCVRAGGKHNDLDQVGYTARHHTFFEMLGNFSFGDYFKKEAIAWAWQLLTETWKLPPERLLATVYHTDDEAYAIWRDDIGLPPERIIRIGDNKGAPFASDNFWQMADTGPCGPCSEIFYDHGPDYAGGPPGSPEEDGDRYIEIWNNVFMQFDRQADGTLLPLPAPCVDTGMGLERLAAVLQGVHSNYETDQFRHLIRAAAEHTGTFDLDNKSLRVIADHIRACAFLIVDGVLPSNEGRGYVLRRIIRRALRHGWMLGVRGGFFWKMVEPLVEAMGEAYPELVARRSLVERALQAEEARFDETLEQGMRIFDEVAARNVDTIPGEDAFRLYDTYGFPVDLTADIARERGLDVDMPGFEAAMQRQRETARAAGKFGGGLMLPAELVARLEPTEFLGYDKHDAGGLVVVALLRDGKPVQSIEPGDEAVVLLDRTPFYAESGGQVGDAGQLAEEGVLFDVDDTQKLAGQFHGHVGRLKAGTLRVGDHVVAAIDGPRRAATVLNHSATHLLHAALRQVLGDHVTQKGSLVAPDRLRFDFAHLQAMTPAEVAEVERRVNAEIRANHEAEVRHMGMQEALDFGAMALFGEKYGEHVRVLRMGDGSIELCGGHACRPHRRHRTVQDRVRRRRVRGRAPDRGGQRAGRARPRGGAGATIARGRAPARRQRGGRGRQGPRAARPAEEARARTGSREGQGSVRRHQRPRRFGRRHRRRESARRAPGRLRCQGLARCRGSAQAATRRRRDPAGRHRRREGSTGGGRQRGCRGTGESGRAAGKRGRAHQRQGRWAPGPGTRWRRRRSRPGGRACRHS